MSDYPSPTFCVMPFLHLSAKTSGALRLCCESPNSDLSPRTLLGKDRVEEIWNGPYYQEVRRKMLNGEKMASCQICYKKEEKGVISRRMEYNEAWKNKLSPSTWEEITALKNQGIQPTPPQYIDLRQGNICNLKCRMCNSMTSSTFAKEWQELQDSHQTVGFDDENDNLKFSKRMQPWYESELFWKDLEFLAPHLKKIYLTGGEPLLIKNNLKLLKRILELGNRDIEISINTNLTVISEEFLEVFSQFKKATFSLSIDGVGKTNDYIRYPSQWNELERNIFLVTKTPIRLDITYTLQAYNFFDIISFIKWVNCHLVERIDYIDWNILDTPSFLAHTIWDRPRRMSYIQELDAYLKNTENEQNQKFYHKLREKFPLLKAPQASPDECEHFERYTQILDQHRGHKLKEEIPSSPSSLSSKSKEKAV